MGPSYWCKDYKTAKQCGAVKYCTEHKWLKQIKGSTCDECKTIVAGIHAYLADNITETEVIQGLEALCSFLGSYATECKALVSSYGKEIMVIVSQYTGNPDLICKMLGLCTSKKTVEVMTKLEQGKPIVFGGSQAAKKPEGSALCIVCEFAMTEIDQLIGKKATEQEIINAVEKVCSYLPSTIKTECDALISEYGPQIIKLLIGQLKPKTICTELHLCSASLKKVVAMPKPKANGIECEACQLVVSYVESLMKNKKTEAEIKAAMEKMCSYLGSYKTECDSIVATYLDLIIKYLSQMPSDQVCKEIGLCTAKSMMNSSKGKLSMGHVASSTECSLCTFAVQYVDSYLKNKKTQAEITTEMKKVCSFLGTYKDECNALISAYLPLMIEYLTTMTPDQICKKLSLCTENTKPLVVEKHLESKVKGGAYCATCKTLVTYVDNLVKDAKTEAEIVTLAEQLCSYLGTYKAECDSLVAAYLPEILKLLAQELSPELVCTELGLCTKSKQTKLSKVDGGQYCQICETVVTYVETLLNNNTEAEVTSLLSQLCNYLGSYKAECNSLVKAYIPQIIELLKKELTPALVCKELGLCTAMNHIVKNLDIKAIKQVKSGVECQFCTMIIGYVDKLIKDKKTQAEITATLEQFCSYTGSYAVECKSLMAAYLPMVYKYLEQELAPAVVCKELGLCTSSKKTTVKVVLPRKEKKVKGGTYCTVCETVVTYVDSLINTKTEAEIVKEVEVLCSYLGSYKAECDSLVAAYLPEIIELLKKEISPALVCKELGLCTAFNKLTKHIKLTGQKAGTVCTLCKFLVGYIDKELKDKKTEAEITAVVDKLCAYLGSYKAECDALVKSYLPLIFQYLAAEMSPELVCKELSLCTTAKPNAKMVLMKKALLV
eukprot:Seg2355.4 transcript_id=Seg2355.4/GoldUCD/mRNA.D3Y31 product=Prosaposin protein_id=Seg2355.4/GoldUCD/D3Y31